MTTLFSPEQTDFLTFRNPEGYGAVILDLVEGFLACPDGRTAIHLTTGIWYESTESIPVLVDRFAGVKKLRYAKDRGETELIKENPLGGTPAISVPPEKAGPPEGIRKGVIWTTKPATGSP